MKRHANCSWWSESFSPCAALVMGLLVLSGCGLDDSSRDGANSEVVAVTRGALRISVNEGGELASENPVVVRSRVEGRVSIIELVDEGTLVEKDDLLARLDSAELEDKGTNQQIVVDKARSDLAQAEENRAIQEKLNEEKLKEADTKLLLATRAHKGYIQGTLPLEEKRLRSQLTIAEEELKRAETEAGASQRLFEKDIIPKTELDADLLGKKKAVEKVDIAKRDMAQFLTWSSKDEIKKLETDVVVKTIALARVRQECSSEEKQKKDLVETGKSNLKLEMEQLVKYTEQLALCEIRAPSSGLVVYARERRRHGSDEPIALGKTVHERERIVVIPDLTNMVVELDIHESSVKKVQRGQRAWVKVDALPGEVFPAVVTRVSLVPSSQSSWMNPDLKVYETTIRLDRGGDGMKPGMHAQVEILVDEIRDARQIPLQCVMQSGSRTFVYVKDGGKIELREVEVGLNNQTFVHVKKGLEDGELVFLTRPESGPALPEPEEQEFRKRDESMDRGADAGTGRRSRAARPDDGNMGRRRGRGASGSGGGAMSDEDRRKLADRLKNMTPEQRRKAMERMGRNRGGGSGGGRGGNGK